MKILLIDSADVDRFKSNKYAGPIENKIYQATWIVLLELHNSVNKQ